MHKPLIAIIEDEQDLAALVADYLNASGYQTYSLHDGAKAQLWLEANQPDLILLDLMLPGVDGLQLCRLQRERSDVPIIMMTAKVEEIDRLLGLELGADDYICKPFSPREVVARVKAVLRRTLPAKEGAAATQPKPSTAITLDEACLQVTVHGTEVELTTIEFKLFALLFSKPGRIFSRQFILDNIYQDYRVVSDRTVDSHIKKLRKKLHVDESSSELIRSVYGSGYKFENP